MGNILIVTGHPYMMDSVGNKKIIEKLAKKYPQAKFSRLEELYKDYDIDVKAEQEKLLWADTIVIQSPLFWYSMTSLIMRWFEEVFVHGWAYGSKGHALDNKKVIVGITAGASNEDYNNGSAGITEEEIVKPIRLIFDYCRMDYLGIVFTGGVMNTGNLSVEEVLKIDKMAEEHVKKIEVLMN